MHLLLDKGRCRLVYFSQEHSLRVLTVAGRYAQRHVLLRKEELGASFATTQFFFDVDRWILLVKRLKERGSQMPIIPGILPISSVKQLVRMADLGGTPIPEDIHAQFIAIESDPVAVKALGVEIATQLCKKLLDAGAPGLHFYTMNTSTATREIWENLGLSK